MAHNPEDYIGRGSSIVFCDYCGKELRRPNNHLRRTKTSFCNKECFDNYQVGENNARWKGGGMEFTCTTCGKVYKRHTPKDEIPINPFCCKKCATKYMRGEKSPGYKAASITLTCAYCGKEYTKYKYEFFTNNFCSNECSGKYHTNERSPTWKGGISYEPYCVLFNKDLRRRVREFWGNKCVMCGATKEDNGNKELCVHHVNYNKDACCNDEYPAYFVILCRKCHSKTNGRTHNRKYWMDYFSKMINDKGGKSYYTKEEYELLLNC